MDLIAALTDKAGISGNQAEALAGGVLGMVQDRVQEKQGDDAAGQLASAVPELDGWKSAADGMADGGGGGGLLGGLAGSVAGALGGDDAEDAVVVAGILQKIGLDSSMAKIVAPILYGFIESRVSPELMGMVNTAAPFLGLVEDDDGDDDGGAGDALGAAAGALGGLFGRKK